VEVMAVTDDVADDVACGVTVVVMAVVGGEGHSIAGGEDRGEDGGLSWGHGAT